MKSISERLAAPLYDVALGQAWAGSSVNCKTYATEPLVFAQLNDGRRVMFGAFFDEDGRLVCYRWQLETGDLRKVAISVPDAPMDAHFTPSVQIDANETVHVLGGAHVNKPFHFLWPDGGDTEALVDVTPALPAELGKASYPSLLLMVNAGGAGYLHLIYRLGTPARSQWRVLRRNDLVGWDGASRSLVTGISSTLWSVGPYLNQPLVFQDGRVGISYCWRCQDVELGRENPKNIGIDYVEFEEGFSGARTSSGFRLSMPVAPGNSERILPVRWGSDLTNQNGAAVLSDGTPAFAASWRSPNELRQIHFCWRDTGGEWQSRPITRFAYDQTMRGRGTLPAAYSRPAIVPAPAGRAIVLYRDDVAGGRLVAQLLSPPHFDPTEHPLITLVAGGLDQYEPAAEPLGSLQSGLLVCFVQRAEQVLGGDGKPRQSAAPARLMAWDISRGLLSEAPATHLGSAFAALKSVFRRARSIFL